MFRLFPFFLLAMLVPLAGADSVWQDGDATGPLVGGFDARLNGQFVHIEQGEDRLDVDVGDQAITILKPLGPATITGPLVDFGDIQVHDNAYHWIHVQGAFTMHAADVQEIPRGLRVDGAYLVARDLDWAHADGQLTIDATDTLISNDGGFQNLGPDPSAWALLQADDDGIVMDWFAFGGAPFATESVGDDVVMDLVGTIGTDAPDVLVRFEETGHFVDRADRFVFRAGSLAARSVPAEDMLNPRGAFSFHARHDGHAIVDMRLPEGLSGEVRWQQDLVPPSSSAPRILNITPYAPLSQAPELLVAWDEPVLGTLRVGGQTKQTVSPAYELRFRLTGLEPETTYSYALEVVDLAGNPASAGGTFTTGPRDGASGAIEVLAIDTGQDHDRVYFSARYDDGEHVPPGMVHVFIDKRNADDSLHWNGTTYSIDVPVSANELRIEFMAPAGRISHVLSLTAVDEAAPGPTAILVMLALAGITMRRR